MATIEQWAEWREGYLLDFSFAVEDCALKKVQTILRSKGKELDYIKALELISEAIAEDYIDPDDPAYLFTLASFYYQLAKNQNRLFSSYHAKDAYYDHKLSVVRKEDIISNLKNLEVYINSVSWFVYIPVIDGCAFFIRNHPLLYRDLLFKYHGRVDLSYCRLTNNQLFEYFCSMTEYSLYKLFVDNKYPHAEELFEAVQENNFELFSKISTDNKIDFTQISEIAGYFLNGQSISVVSDNQEAIESKTNTLFSMVGIQKDDFDKVLLPKILNHVFVREVLPFELTEDNITSFTYTAFNVAIYLPFWEMFDDEELSIMNKVIENPYFIKFMKIVQYVRLSLAPYLPKGVKLILSSEEMERFLPKIDIENIYAQEEINNSGSKTERSDEALAANEQIANDDTRTSQFHQALQASAQEIKTLASRWMTEPYQRMTDNTLVELLSQKIWPQLSSEIDGLQWTPKKRALPTFPKTKNALAACVLFHSLELARMAKLPKQEDDEVRDVEFMSAEDRAQAGISATSNLNAGITHTKKKYNDTLPVGYMEVLKKFIKEEDLPGRTTSRTYLKLVNKWVKLKLESIRDNIESEASAQLFIAECKNELGPQFEIFQDNRVRLKALLKKWRDSLPELFNIPI